ncbi:MAG: ethanolamine ammonia-lyase [Pseudopedobacter saltans]|uniref:Ethanolamine ammonia-lyase small subunit n=1 Tax=Pseudopedobacter saltans TaxID=151895 RepID=A0A2W5F4H1_9SPHI|nr:MAG: ethanolamine ammonia-lyase [Pseudopedobacter saltans]
MELGKIQNIQDDNWSTLKDFTQARIALGRTGVAIPLKETLQFRLAHAHARDAVYSALDLEKLHTEISELGLDYMDVQSEVQSRDEYLKRPDKGRELGGQSRLQLRQLASNPCDICIVLSDGLSAMAINENAIPLIQILSQLSKKMHYSWTPIVLVDQGRVAVADEIAAILQASIVIHLIGERPGLSSSNSLGAYITYHPQKGLTDETRNCISNIRPEGLQIPIAAEKIMYLVRESLRMGLSGVQLKDTFPGHLLLD